LLGASTGLVGDWFTQGLLGVLGGPLTLAFTTVLLGAGVMLTFDVSVRTRFAAR
jgi:hypothetical protein